MTQYLKLSALTAPRPSPAPESAPAQERPRAEPAPHRAPEATGAGQAAEGQRTPKSEIL
ncbi:hypothetical protein [Vannielia litorea]|uniref:hypothetical protein n=1 Tax=Vannielia litorea TaxID=1217970 RepID=UPI001C969875|nr:hypothetical protein [Vannielia litorea]MBY6048089.1 hypothetical protein [Vannielia litorea]MBY6075503.1 hypothetical protein [Vannielia litorea]